MLIRYSSPSEIFSLSIQHPHPPLATPKVQHCTFLYSSRLTYSDMEAVEQIKQDVRRRNIWHFIHGGWAQNLYSDRDKSFQLFNARCLTVQAFIVEPVLNRELLFRQDFYHFLRQHTAQDSCHRRHFRLEKCGKVPTTFCMSMVMAPMIWLLPYQRIVEYWRIRDTHILQILGL